MQNPLDGCQIPCLPHMAEGRITSDHQSFIQRLKRSLAVPWNYYAKPWLKRLYYQVNKERKQNQALPVSPETALKYGDVVRVRSWDEIAVTLDSFKELKVLVAMPSSRSRLINVLQIS